MRNTRIFFATLALAALTTLTACGSDGTYTPPPPAPKPENAVIKKSMVFDYTENQSLNEVEFELTDGTKLTCIVLDISKGGGVDCLEPGEDAPR